MGLFASCSDEVLSAALLLLLFSSTALCECPTPVLPPHSSLRTGEVLPDTYPVETVLRLQCIAGHEIIPGTIPRMICLETNKWSELPTLCQGKRCPIPNIENGHVVSSVDLRSGEEITLGCDYGFRIIGGATRQCVLRASKVDWNRDLPICQRISCARPPKIPNGRYDPSPSDTYDAGWIVIYRCDDNYSLIGNSTITCVVAENGVDGKWNFPSPECKQVKCRRPSIPNGKVASVFQATYMYQNKLPIECDPGYTFVGASLIECDADSQWKPPGPWCDKVPATSKSPTPAVTPTPPISLRPGTVTPKEDGTEGQSCGDPGKPENGDRIILTDFLLRAEVNFTCNKGYQLIGSPTSQCLSRSRSNNTVVWKPKPPICFRPTCPPPSEIRNGTYTGGKNGTFPLNSNVTYICDLGFSLSGNNLLHCITEDNKTGIWRGSLPECKGKI